MDQELMDRAEPALGMYACDREMFERVWQRVMPGGGADCPIAVNAPAEPVHTPVPAPVAGVQAAAEAVSSGMDAVASQPSEAVPAPAELPDTSGGGEQETANVLPVPDMDMAAPEPPASGGAAGPAEGEPMPEPPESAASTGDDFPRPDAVPCLGSGSAGHGNQLQEDILAALEGWQLYRHLARKVTGSAARTLSALASEKHRQARKLAAAYFLISGVRYWPTDRLESPKALSWLGTLRRRFADEQQLDSRWRSASLDTEDSCLADLYSELAEGCAAHAGVLRTLLENAL